MDTGTRIRDLRKAKNLSQEELGRLIGCTESAVSCYELNKREPSFDMLLQIAEVLDSSAQYLLTGAPGGRVSDYVEEQDELEELLETLRSRDDMRMLFKLAKDATPEDVRQAVKIIEALRGE